MVTGYTAEVPRSPHTPKNLRFPPDLAERVEALAARESRTFSAQVFRMLREWLQEHREVQERQAQEARGEGQG